MGGEQSEAFYQEFLQHMRKVYTADAIKGNKNWFIESFSQLTGDLSINYPIMLSVVVSVQYWRESLGRLVNAKQVLHRLLANQRTVSR